MTDRPSRILVIDDEENMRHMLSVMLTRQGYHSDTAEDGAAGLEMITQNHYDFVLCDIRMPRMDGREFLRRALEHGAYAPVIMMSAYGAIDTAIECVKHGAYDFISKPFKKDEIVMVLKKAEERERLKSEVNCLRAAVQERDSFHGIISQNRSMLEIFAQIGKVASLKTTVLVTGESGTGKELVARAVHLCGHRAAAPFVAVNCGAIPDSLLESELFGHVRGAFTDASADKTGLVEQADGGTLLLDEIGEMPLHLQVKLLRVLQEEEIRRVGAATARKVNVRVIAATSRNLENDVAAGRFREDLYFRLNVFRIHLPPLRERPEDIPKLVEHFCSRFSPEVPVRCTPDAMRRLLAYGWPGNIRELENAIERGIILCGGALISGDHLPLSVTEDGSSPREKEDIEESLSIKKAEETLERDLIFKALQKTGGNRTHAARILEISHRSLLYKIKEYGIE